MIRGVDCPACGAQTNVLETRKGTGGAVRRRRSCPDCGERFTTHEQRIREPLYVVKRSGRRQRFDRTKLRAGLIRATHKRDVSDHDVEGLVERIEAEAERSGGEIASARVGEMSLAGLRELDLGAYLQFVGVYRELEDLDSVRKELEQTGNNPANRGQTAAEVRPIQRARSGVTPKRRDRGDG
jgi:transcriptional repressor NrdR